MKRIKGKVFAWGKFLAIFALVFSVSINIALYHQSKAPTQYSLQGSYQTESATETEKEYLVITTDTDNSFSIYSHDGTLLNAGSVIKSGKDNFYMMEAKNNQTFALLRCKGAAYMFDGREWIEFSLISSAIRTFSEKNVM